MPDTVVHFRKFGAFDGAGLAYIDCVASADGSMRLFCRAGVGLRQFAGPAFGTAVIRSGEEIGTAAFLRLYGAKRIGLVEGGVHDLAPSRAEPEIFAGKRTLLGSRYHESAAQVAEWLAYHATHHEAEAALLIDRTEGAERFAEELRETLAGTGLTVLVIGADVPLGRRGMIGLPELAEDGQVALPEGGADAWLSGAVEPLVYEALKWRFLTDASVVLQLDCADVLLQSDINAFRACLEAPYGVVRLIGRKAYPWRVKRGDLPRLWDHVYCQFDERRGIQHWGVCPRRAGLNRAWRFLRIVGIEGGPEVAFFRAMSLRAPDQPVSRLVGKSALVEDAALLGAAQLMGHVPKRAPSEKIRTAREAAPDTLRTTIVTCMRNEGPFILEWIAYHRSIGVTGFIVYTNDCTDGTDTLLSLLQEKGICQHRVNPWTQGSALSPQYAAFDVAQKEAVVREADWLITMDVDEFMNVKIGDGSLAALYTAMGDANLISLTWRLFGDSGVKHYVDSPIIGQFDRCAQEVIRKPHQAWGFKTLFRNIDVFKKLGVHRPKGLKPEHWQAIRWLNGSGREMPEKVIRTGWRSTMETYGYDWVQLNHYAVRSVESFLVKRDRGRVNHTQRDQGENYWFRMSHNACEDRSIMRRLPQLEAEMARLLADPEIRAAHEDCVTRHQAKITQLLDRPDQKDFFAVLTGPRMTRLTRMQKHFGTNVFLQGPNVIPDSIALNDSLAEDFFFTVEAGENST